MKKQKDYSLLLILIIVLIAVLAASCGRNYSPVDNYVEFVVREHGEHCKYPIGYCPVPECSHANRCPYEGAECPNVQAYINEHK